MARGVAPALALASARESITAAGFVIDYVSLADNDMQPTENLPARLLAAAKIGTTRLIDNVPVTLLVSR
jgi:pantoate--beta-alanine ligase